MAIENSTGKILAFIGGRDFEIENNWNHATQAFRHNRFFYETTTCICTSD